MRRAGRHGTVVRQSTPNTSPVVSPRNGYGPPLGFNNASTSTVAPPTAEVRLSAGGTFAAGGVAPDACSDRHRQLAIAIKQRIESRLPGRVRNLEVRIMADTVLLEGQCCTYYTKQLAQHAALGILEDEHLENAIVVVVGQ